VGGCTVRNRSGGEGTPVIALSSSRNSVACHWQPAQTVAIPNPRVPEFEPVPLDIQKNRAARKYSRSEQALRVAWALGRWLFRLSPYPCYAWRRWVLRLFGARVGRDVRTAASTHLYMPWNVEIGDWAAIGPDVFVYSLGKVRIGARATVSYRTHVCAGTHDFSDPAMPLLKPPVTIEEDAWVGTDAFIGPGVTVGRGSMVAARAVVVKDVDPFTLVGGHPARIIGQRPILTKATPHA
jgi:putative colanic acid biosynthesis acetyltransferase WcaF